MEKYSFNKVRFAVGLLVVLWLAHATVMDNREMKTNRHEVKIEFLLTLAVALPLFWLVTVRLQLSKHGLRYASLSGSKEMRWRDVSLLFVSWRQRYLARIVPIYRAYRVEVVDRQGARLVFGNRFQGIAALAERVRTEPMPSAIRASHTVAIETRRKGRINGGPRRRLSKAP